MVVFSDRVVSNEKVMIFDVDMEITGKIPSASLQVSVDPTTFKFP